MKRILLLAVIIAASIQLKAETGYDLWLRYTPVEDQSYAKECRSFLKEIYIEGDSETTDIIRRELQMGLRGMLGKECNFSTEPDAKKGLVLIKGKEFGNFQDETEVSKDAYAIVRKGRRVVIISNSDIGLLYGTFHFLRLIQTRSDLSDMHINEVPGSDYRILNHWDNLDRTVERGYAGFSIWDWHKLPEYKDQRYIDYARANASVGINGSVLTNVNSNSLVLTSSYLEKTKALAEVFRPYGIKVYLTARFSAPIELGGLKTADPLDEEVVKWWQAKAREIYELIPDFGGFLVKANSEGQPGPQDYDRSHAEGANMLARAVKPYGGIVMWRAFVYSHEVPEDRAKQAYTEFMPLDKSFDSNVFVQVKNGPVDFQPREPFHPLFGAMKHTPLMMEFQITQEYLGCATHLVYLAPLFKEVLESDTYAEGKGTSVSTTIQGYAGVANIGNDINWTGHPFGQANWYAYGRLAWNANLSSETIAGEWLRMTFSNEPGFLNILTPVMLESRETAVDYMTPLGLHHQMAEGHHWGPGPWVDGVRPDWTSIYYHRADSLGLGFDRSSTGSGATFQYFPEVRELFDSPEACPEKLLLWFHHVSWDYRMESGRTLWQELVYRYYSGAAGVKKMQEDWLKIEAFIDRERFERVRQLLAVQADEAIWWRNSMLLYFQQFSGQPIPDSYEQPEHTLEYYKNKKSHFVPGI